MRKYRWLMKRTGRKFLAYFKDNPLDPLPIRRGFRGYGAGALRSDLGAGLNVALLAFPQAIAYAVIAGIPIQFGIVCSAVAALVAPLFSGSRYTVLGPTNATAFMLFVSFSAFAPEERLFFLPMLVLLVGLLLVAGALLRVGELIQYISRSVVVGYITGASVLIMANQLQHLMGVELGGGQGTETPRTFFTILQATLARIGEARWQPLALGGATLVIWFLLDRKCKKLPGFALTLLIMSGAYFFLHRHAGWEVGTFSAFDLSDLVPRMPRFSEQGPFADIGLLFGAAVAIAFLGALENSVMSKTLASRVGDRPDVNQDMISVGLANVVNAFAGGMPASGSMTRSALNFSSGAVSRLSSIFSGVLGVIGALLLGHHLDWIPKCVLAALVIGIALSLISRKNLRITFFATPSDAAVLVGTFVSALLLPLNVAIFLGVGLSILLYLRAASKPYLAEYEMDKEEGVLREAGEKRARPVPAISIVHVEGDLFFGAAELFRTQIQKSALDPALRIIILRMKNARHLDATSVMALEELIRFLREHDRDIILSGVTREVFRVLRNSGMIDVVGKENLFRNNNRNPNLSTRYALKRALELLGTEDADIKIFYDPTKDKKKKDQSKR